MPAAAPLPRVILLHGFNVKDDGAGSILKLAPFLEAAGFRVKRFRYGFFFLLRVRFLVERFARVLADMSEPGDIVIGHSNGCLMAMIAAEHGATFAQMVFINPALDNDTPLPPHVGHLTIWHSPSDWVVRVARLLFAHRWGDMGAVGYRGKADARITSINKENAYEQATSSEHSDVFAEPQLSFFGPEIVRQIKLRLP